MEVNPSMLLIRVDGGGEIGTGHVMRCCALAEAWRSTGGSIQFCVAEVTPSLESRMRVLGPVHRIAPGERGTLFDAVSTAELARTINAAWIVADGYAFGSEWQRATKSEDLSLLIVDDYGHATHYFADAVLNQNLGASAATYSSRESYTKLLLGTQYVLLRPEFSRWRGWTRPIPETATRLLVTLGGSDPHNVTLRVVEALDGFSDWEISVVIGESNPHLASIQRATAKHPNIHLLVGVADMSQSMATSDIAVSAGGTTSWELAFMGLPSILVTLADNQRHVAAALTCAGIAMDEGQPDSVDFAERVLSRLTSLRGDAPARARMSELGRHTVDGLGSARVVAKIRSMTLGMRRATSSDARLLWTWGNDEVTRSMSFCSDTIPWTSHLEWMEQKLSSPDCYFFIVTTATGAPLGQVRFDVEANRATISVGLAPEARGRGIGPAAIIRSVDELFKLVSVHIVDAFIRPQNVQSCSAFSKASFTEVGLTETRLQRALHFRRERQAHE